MQNEPVQGNPTGVNHPVHQEAATDENRLSDNETKETKEEKKDTVEETSIPEDYEKFNVDKVDDLEKTKNKTDEDKEN
jgi:hypothetical protein